MSDVEMVVGQEYRVRLQDCCIEGSFIAILETIDYDPSDSNKKHPRYSFDNGVFLENSSGCVFEKYSPSSLFFAG